MEARADQPKEGREHDADANARNRVRQPVEREQELATHEREDGQPDPKNQQDDVEAAHAVLCGRNVAEELFELLLGAVLILELQLRIDDRLLV